MKKKTKKGKKKTKRFDEKGGESVILPLACPIKDYGLQKMNLVGMRMTHECERRIKDNHILSNEYFDVNNFVLVIVIKHNKCVKFPKIQMQMELSTSKVEAGQAAAHLCSRVYGTRAKVFSSCYLLLVKS